MLVEVVLGLLGENAPRLAKLRDCLALVAAFANGEAECEEVGGDGQPRIQETPTTTTPAMARRTNPIATTIMTRLRYQE